MIESSGCTFVAESLGSVEAPSGRRLQIQVVDPGSSCAFSVQRLGRLGLGDLEMGELNAPGLSLYHQQLIREATRHGTA